MRPIKLGPYTPAVASTTAFNAQTFNSTGAATAPTTTSTTDGLAHYVTLTSPAQVYAHDANSVSTTISALAAKTTTISANASVSATGVLLLINSLTATATVTVFLNQASGGMA